MEQLKILANALNYIEENIGSTMKTEDIAGYCYCSKAALEKLFRCINNISVHDYIIRRRMTCAGRMLISQPEKSILEVALEYGYGSNEAFTRAFNKIWNCNPVDFRKNSKYTELFPKYLGYTTVEEVKHMNGRKNVDISELYDLFSSRRGCYFVCSDIAGLVGFNEVSREAGDLAILEAMNRMNREAADEEYVFRIGADEFVMLTNSRDEVYAEAIAERIRNHNGEKFDYGKEKLELKLYVSTLKLDDKVVRYRDLFDKLHVSITASKYNQD